MGKSRERSTQRMRERTVPRKRKTGSEAPGKQGPVLPYDDEELREAVDNFRRYVEILREWEDA